jgi:hypothetical protein
MRRRPFTVLLVVVGATLMLAASQRSENTRQREQRHFSTEQQIVPLDKPVAVSEDVARALRDDDILVRASRSCLKAGETARDIPSSWFVASEVHLDGPDETDLVVLPQKQCMNGANVGPFWLVRRSATAPRILLSTGGHDLEIIDSRRNGYRDIRSSAFTATMVSTTIFRYDGETYKPYKGKTEPIR